MRGQGLQKLYLKGGAPMLAYRLNLVFRILETPEQVAIHNEVVDEVLDIINNDYPAVRTISGEQKQLQDYIAEILLTKRAKRRNFLYRVAVRALEIAHKKG